MAVKLSFRRSAVLVLAALLAFAGVWIAVFASIAPFFFAPDPHLFFSTSQLLLIFGAPAIVAAVAMAGTLTWLNRWGFETADGPRGTRRSRWAVRLIAPLLIALGVAGFREVLFEQTVAEARTNDEYGQRGSMLRLAESTRGRRALVRIVGDRNIAIANRVQAAWALEERQHESIPNVEVFIGELIQNPDAAARTGAASIVGNLGPQRASIFLPALLQDRNTDVVLATLAAMEQLELRAEPELVQRLEPLTSSENVLVRGNACNRLLDLFGRSGDKNATRRLLNSPNPDLRIMAADRLADAEDFSGFDAALTELRADLDKGAHRSYNAFVMATSVLRRSGDPRAAPVLWTLANCPGVNDEQRERARIELRELFRAKGEIPQAYREVSPGQASSRPEWRTEYCAPVKTPAPK